MAERIGAIAAILVAIAVPTACGSGTSPAPPLVSTTYALVSINGSSLPIPDPTDPASAIVSGSIVLVGTDSAQLRETVQTPSSNGNPPLTEIQLGYYSVARMNSSLGLGNGTALIFQPHQFGIAIDSATLSAGQLALRHHVQPGGPIELRVYVSP